MHEKTLKQMLFYSHNTVQFTLIQSSDLHQM